MPSIFNVPILALPSPGETIPAFVTLPTFPRPSSIPAVSTDKLPPREPLTISEPPATFV